MSSASGVSEYTPQGKTGAESFGGEATKLRLLQGESRLIRYCLAEWDGEAGLGSNLSAQLERLAAKPELIEPRPRRRRNPDVTVFGGQRWRYDWACDAQTMHVKASAPCADVDAMAPQERWADKATANERFGRPDLRGETHDSECDLILRAWRALMAMARRRDSSVIILQALYGDLPPGLPTRGLWNKSVDDEYRRVSRYAAASGGTAAALEALVHVDKKRRDDESKELHRARVIAEQTSRTKTLQKVGNQCEELIVKASHGFRRAWKEA